MEEAKTKYLRIFQENLMRVRKQAGLSQGEVGAKIGMKQTQYSKLEVTDVDPRISTVERVSQALDIPLQELFRINDPSDLEANQLIARIFEMDLESREPLLKVIEGYVRHYELNRNVRPQSTERLQELKAIQASKNAPQKPL